jgi:hypothetical protein
MDLDHWPGERGAVVRYSGPVISRAALRRHVRSVLACAGVLAALVGTASAQEAEPAADQAAAPAEPAPPARRAANIQWNPKTTPEEIKELRKIEFRDFDPATKAPNLSDAQREALTKFIRHAIYMLTVEQEVDNYPTIIERKILAPIERGTTSAPARSYMLETVLKTAEELLFEDTQPAIVQFNLVILAASLNERPADNARRPAVPAVPYLASHKLLLRVVKEPKFPTHCRLMAAVGLDRILRDGEPSNVNRADIGRDLAPILAEPIEDPVARKWFRIRLIEAMGKTNRVYDTGNNPVILDGLVKVMADPQEDWDVRASAARAVSQLPFDGQTNVELINHEIGKLVYDMGTAYNASKNRKDSQWRRAFTSAYLAYRSKDETDQKVRHWGLMFQQIPRGKPVVEAAYKVMLPIFKVRLETPDGPNDPVPGLIAEPSLKALADWLAKNKPTDRKTTPNSPELKEVAASKVDAVSAENPEPSVTRALGKS